VAVRIHESENIAMRVAPVSHCCMHSGGHRELWRLPFPGPGLASQRAGAV